MKNKKIISLVCALAMVFSMFSAFTVNAADEKGIALAGSLSEDGKTITIEATATGVTGPLNSFLIAANAPEGVTEEDLTVSPEGFTTSVVNGVVSVAFLDITGNGKTFEDNKLATITMTLDEPLAEDYVMTLNSDSSIDDGTEVTVKGGMEASTTTVSKWVDPNAPTPKPTSPARPTMAPIGGGDEPVPTAVPAVGKGIDLKSSIDSANKVITVEATAVGVDGPLNSFLIAMNAPEGVTESDMVVTPEGFTTSVVNGVISVAFLDVTGNGKTFDDNKLATITITLPNALTAPLALTLNNDASIDDGTEVTVKGGMTPTSTVVVPNEEIDTPDPIDEVALKDFVADGADDAVTAEEKAGNTVYITVEVKKNDGTDAVYGVDYAAKYDGKVLTEAEYINLISGYTDDSMVDVINGLTFEIYNDDVESISTTVNSIDKDTGVASQITDPVVDQPISEEPTPTEEPTSTTKLTVTPTSKSMSTNSALTVAATVKNPVEGGKVEFEVENPTNKLVLVLVSTTSLNSSNVASASLLSTDKTGTAKVIVKYLDADGNAVPGVKDVTVKVTVTKSSSSSSSSSDDTSSTGNTGVIAGPSSTINGGYTGTSAFTDLGDVEWAQEAINTLAAKGIVSGRDAYTFDPNANITRAEYCQILVGAIGKSQDAADSSFYDVASDAWYYHAVSVASYYGIVSGYGDGNFGPNDLITRQDMALMTYKAAIATGKNLAAIRTLTFGDADQISDYAVEAVTTLTNAGIINGMSEAEFAPKANATRAQAAVILYQTFVK